ncbi:DNA helicase rad5 [Serendipita sp. 399]|nr:DNA helicase rad5 [Serendipita sp. 399]
MDYLDDTTRIDSLLDEDSAPFESGYFAAEQDVHSSPPPTEPLFLSDSDQEIVEVPSILPDFKHQSTSPEIDRPTKRRKLATPPEATPDPGVLRKDATTGKYYIGDFLVDGAYSLVSGIKAIRPGERVFISRSSQIDTNMSKEPSSKPKEKSKGKQTTLTGFVSKTAKPSKGVKKVDNIVRFISERGSQLGRLPVSTAEFIGICLDLQLAIFSGIVIEAPERIRIGDSLLLSIRAYLNPSAFQKPSTVETEEKSKIFSEGTETDTERMLRERKASLLKLLDKVGLRPRISVPVIKPDNTNTGALTTKSRQGTHTGKKMKTEIVGEGDDMEEIEVEEDDEEVLDDNELDIIYKKAQKHDIGMEEMEPSETFAMQLRPYQKQALKWMKSMEEGENDARNSRSMHPLWQEFAFPSEPTDTGVIDLCEDEQPFYFNPYSGELSLEFPQSTTNSRGGILGDGEHSLTAELPAYLNRWTSTFREGTLEAELEELDVLITSYGVLSSEHSKHEGSKNTYRSPLFEIIDEAHHIKSRISKTAKAVYAVQAQRKWALTGTPIVNRLEDLQSLLHFLGFKPWSEYSFFRSFITIPFLSRDPKALDIVQVILESILLRREKNMKDKDGNPIVKLPGKTVVVEKLEFSPLERQIYDQVYHNARSTFKTFDAKGTVGRNWHSLFALLMRLRRAVLHPALISAARRDISDSADRDGEVNVEDLVTLYMNQGGSSSGATNDNNFARSNLAALRDKTQECPICLESMDPPILIPTCMHTTLYERPPTQMQDLVEVLRTKRTNKSAMVYDSSPEPEGPVDAESDEEPSKAMEVSEPEDEREASVDITFRKNNFQSSTKLDALINDLNRLREEVPGFKAVIFSQFTGFLDLIEVALDRHRFPWVRLDGSMSEKQRAGALKQFATPSKREKLFIISLRAGGVGLNLTTANYVFMMDCWWNSAIEQQAIDRVHRLGQEREVFVKHYTIAKSIEKRVLEIQKRKTAIVSFALGKSNASTSEGIENLRIMFEDEDN